MLIKSAKCLLFMLNNMEIFMGISQIIFFTTNAKLFDCKEIKKTEVCMAHLNIMNIKNDSSCIK